MVGTVRYNARMRALDLTGQKFGRLTAVEFVGRRGKYRMWSCTCECGGSAVAAVGDLRFGHTRSCGCLRREINAETHRTHGLSRTPEHIAWCGMKARCYNSSERSYRHYVARGIRVCNRWCDNFEAFLEDMGPRPTAKHSVERLDVNGDYHPSNCVWATRTQQARNRTDSVRWTFAGRTMTMAAWAEALGVHPNRLATRKRAGWPVERILSEPIGAMLSAKRLTIDGVTLRLAQWAKLNGIKPGTAKKRISYGWSPLRAVTVPVSPSRRYPRE